MSTQATPALPAASAAAPVKLTAIQVIEQELGNFLRQREQAVANVHAVEGAIQATQQLLAKLKAEVEKAEAFVKAEAEKAVAAVEKL
jgi:hypothetical protein